MTKTEIALAVATPLVVAGARWTAIAVCSVQAAKAEADGIDDWRDLFWPRMLNRLSKKQAAHVEREVNERLAGAGGSNTSAAMPS